MPVVNKMVSNKLSYLIFIILWMVCSIIFIYTLRILETRELNYFLKYYTINELPTHTCQNDYRQQINK